MRLSFFPWSEVMWITITYFKHVLFFYCATILCIKESKCTLCQLSPHNRSPVKVALLISQIIFGQFVVDRTIFCDKNSKYSYHYGEGSGQCFILPYEERRLTDYTKSIYMTELLCLIRKYTVGHPMTYFNILIFFIF